MLALDTNVLVRFLVADDDLQSARAAKLITSAIEADERLFVSDLVLCEVVWVLDAAYRVKKREIAQVLAQVLRARHLAFDDVERLHRALAAFDQGKGDFADYLIREHAAAAGCSEVRTFDKALLKEPGFGAA